MFQRPCHLYVFRDSHSRVFMPQYMPSPLQTSTSMIQWSHQHSLKLGSWCSRLYSRNSNMTLTIVHIHQSRIIRV